jgi:hypothetical protein
MLISQQGLEDYADEIEDDILGRTFGGILSGNGLVSSSVSEGQYQGLAYKAWNIVSTRPSHNHHVQVVTHIAQTKTLNDWKQGLKKAMQVVTNNRDHARKKTRDWWAGFWNRSWICIHPENPDPSNQAWRAARNYNLYRYQIGCNAFGEYPTKFNGGNLTIDARLSSGQGYKGPDYGPDWRRWGGGVFTAQNQRLLYWPMLKCGDFDAILPQFELYRKALGGARARVKKHFGHDGAIYSEYNSVPGMAVGSGYGWSEGQRKRGTEIPLGDPRANAARGFNDLVEPGIMANAYIAYHWESQLEHAYMIMEYHRFTGADISKYMPFIENAVIFFDEHYRLRQKLRNGKELDPRGKLVIYPSTGCEAYRGATNPTDVVAGLRACLESILELDDSLLTLRSKAFYEAFLKTIPDYVFGEINGYPVIKPAMSYVKVINVDATQFYPLFPFNRFDLIGQNRNQMEIFRNTWKYDKTISKGKTYSWHHDSIFQARMGLVQEAAEFTLKKLDNSERRFPTFWSSGDGLPDHNWGGSAAIGVQEMLMQTLGKNIYLLPAWPKQWDVDFKLHAPYNTTIQGKVRDGNVVELKVTPDSRKGVVSIIDS